MPPEERRHGCRSDEGQTGESVQQTAHVQSDTLTHSISLIDQVEDGHNDFIETELVDENGQLQMNDWVTTDTLAFETRFSANSQRSSYRTITSTGHDFEGYVDYTLVTDYDNDEDPYQSGRSTETAEATRRQSNVESRVVTVSGWLGREPDRRTVVGGTRSTGKSITTRMVSSDIVTHGFAGDYQHEVDAVQRERKWSRSSSDYGTDSQHGQITSVIARTHAVEFEWSVDSTHSQRTTSSGPDPAEFEFELNTRIYNSTVEFGGPPVGFETTAQLRRSSLEFSIGEDTDGDGVHDQFTGPYTEWFSIHTDTWPEGGVSGGGGSSQAEVGSYDPSTVERQQKEQKNQPANQDNSHWDSIPTPVAPVQIFEVAQRRGKRPQGHHGLERIRYSVSAKFTKNTLRPMGLKPRWMLGST